MKAIEFTERLKKTIRQAGIPGDYRVNAYCELDDDQDVEEYEEAFSCISEMIRISSGGLILR